MVREKSGSAVDDGTAMMQSTFSLGGGKEPLNRLRLADPSTRIGQNEQDGYRNLFAGAQLGIMNVCKHGEMSIEAGEALELIGLASLLARRVDRATVVVLS